MDLQSLAQALQAHQYRLHASPPPPPPGRPPKQALRVNQANAESNFQTPKQTSQRRASLFTKTSTRPDKTVHVLGERSLNQQATASAQRLKELATDKSRYYVELERKKAEEEKQVRESMLKRTVTTESKAQKASQRLYDEAQRRERRLVALRVEDRSRNENTPIPPRAAQTPAARRLSEGQIATMLPLHERTDLVMKQRQQKIQQVRMSIESAEQARHNYSKITVDPTAVTERIIHEAQALKKKREQHVQQLLDLERPTGLPNINQKSRLLAEKMGYTDLPFLERQEHERKERETTRMQLQATDAANVLRRTSKILSPHSVKKLTDRLSEEDALSVRQARERAESEYLGQFTFAPDIDQRSREIAPYGSGGLHELHRNEAAQAKKLELAKRVEQEQMRECTFHPQILPSRYWSETGSSEDARVRREREREEKLRQARWEIEMKETSECTFRPYVNLGHPPQPCMSTSHAIKGMHEYLERRRSAEDMKEMQKEREEKVFLTKLPPITRRFTVVEPFNLS